ncbi:MAG: type II toxin-antitoxin system RelB/DinJ family antitoxin [Anaerovibrio sp.]|uniref:type II toxin-antitoxin system RelB/DinJ family antitoxin n=1 Tax=Anaerovibrio sp. TaxID=1872532 RepID=UPI0025B9BF9C|nr:type II toxin-antitoxin system RelB/DinJ family antitoxin [Anaerovibrio sp.]MBE6100201.1 type II toxin-antitoxin system RelB/DinJ family antitoxin [Anaerovibrio sp.]
MASTTTSMSIRMDRAVKEQSQQLFKALGMDMTTAINIFLRQALIKKGLPFEVTAEGADSILMQRLAEADNDHDIHGPFNTVQALMEDLNAND